MRIAVVGGAGRVGLPLSVLLAEAGHTVVAIDIDETRVDQIRNGHVPFKEDGLDVLLAASIRSGRLRASHDLSDVQSADVIFLIVGTGLDEDGNPQNDSVLSVVAEMAPFVQSHAVVALRSTVMVGTTELVASILGNRPGFVAYCPERIAEGNAIEEIAKFPQIIGCEENAYAFEVLKSVFATLGIEILKSSLREAELGKLILNTWRYSQFAIANEFHLLCEEHGVRYQRVRELVSVGYPRSIGLVKSGMAGGPCLEKDSRQLVSGYKHGSNLFQEVIQAHAKIIDHLVQEIQREHDLEEKVIAFLGITFKPDSDDLRNSPALELARKLEPLVKELIIVDPFVGPNSPFVIVDFKEAIEKCDIVVVGTLHSSFARDTFEKPVFDPFGVRDRDTFHPR